MVLTILFLVLRGMRGFWTWVLVLFSLAHALEHTYMWVRFLTVTRDLQQLGFLSASRTAK